jgi:AraC-like DNA-binding protein
MKESVAYQRVPDAPGLVLSTGHYTEYEFKPHYHLDYHLGVIVNGVQRQKINGKSALFGPGCISVVPPDQIHDGSTCSINSNEHYTLHTFRISAELLDGYLQDIFQVSSVPNFHGALIEDLSISKTLLEMHALLNQGNPLQQLTIEQQWIATLEPLFLKLGAKPRPIIEGGLGNYHWQLVRDYCHDHIDTKITLETLASLCQLSRFQFLRRFETTTGLTPRAWLIRLRLESACVLLKHPNQSIAQVASDVGFYDQSHFNRAFRHAFGVAPSRY